MHTPPEAPAASTATPAPTGWAAKFFTIWTGQIFSLVGSALVQFALVWWLTQQTGSATILATSTLVALLPQIVLGPFVGALVDRWNRRLIMIVADTAIAAVTGVLIFLFAYFWVTVQFQPKEMAKNLRDSGSFIPGLRPGRRTAEYLETVMTRITYYGAGFLAIIAVVPSVIAQSLDIPFNVTAFLGGTGLLIVVSVSLDLVQKIEANLLMRSYDGFSGAGRIKGAYS